MEDTDCLESECAGNRHGREHSQKHVPLNMRIWRVSISLLVTSTWRKAPPAPPAPRDVSWISHGMQQGGSYIPSYSWASARSAELLLHLSLGKVRGVESAA
jgi:hypothetical protein